MLYSPYICALITFLHLKLLAFPALVTVLRSLQLLMHVVHLSFTPIHHDMYNKCIIYMQIENTGTI